MNYNRIINFKHWYFYFLSPLSRESIVFGSNFRNGDFDDFTRFEVIKNYIKNYQTNNYERKGKTYSAQEDFIEEIP